jgi:hypothetical protein
MDLKSVIGAINDMNILISKTKKEIENSPDDDSLKFMLEQDLFLRTTLISQYSTITEQIHQKASLNLQGYKHLNGQKICDCTCHIDLIDVKHCYPCCDNCYEKYINSDGSVDEERLTKIIYKK